VDPVPDPPFLRKSGTAGNRTRDLCICSQKLIYKNIRGLEVSGFISDPAVGWLQSKEVSFRHVYSRDRDSSVGIATGYELDDCG
jgi:hypothetical protein